MVHFPTCLPVAAARLRVVRLTASFAQAGGQATQTGACAKCLLAIRLVRCVPCYFSAVRPIPSAPSQALRAGQTFAHLLWRSLLRRPGKSERELFRRSEEH